MDELYNVNLFNQDFSIEGIDCKLLSQLFIKVKERHFAKILLFCSKEGDNRLFLTALDTNNNLVPIPMSILNTIICAIKQIPFGDEHQSTISSLSIRDYGSMSKPMQIKLVENFSALVNSTANILKEKNIELELLEGSRISPDDFVFAAFSGIDTSIYFVLDDKYVSRNKNWGVLSKICFYINGNYSGEYFCSSNHIIEEGRIGFLCQTKLNSVLSKKRTSGIHMACFLQVLFA